MRTYQYKQDIVLLAWGTYAEGGRPSLQLVDAKTGEPVTHVTVNLPEETLPEGCAFIKNYSENEGLYAWLLINKLILPTGRTVPAGFVEVPMVRWTDAALEEAR